MNGATQRQKVLLGILFFVLLFALWQAVGPSDDAGAGSAPAPAPVDLESAGEEPARPQLPGAGKKQEKVDQVVELRLPDLDVPQRDYAPGRDPWRFYEPPPPGPSPEELARQRAEAERLAREAEQRRLEELRRQQEIVAQQPPPEPPKPQPPPFTYKYLGYFGPPSSRLAAFTDGTNRFIVREGQMIEGKFVVAKIGYESVDIQFVGFPDTPAQRVPVGR